MSKLKLVLSLCGLVSILVVFFHNCGGGDFQSRKWEMGGDSSREAWSLASVENSVKLPFTGNGANTSWDGRLVIFATGTGWRMVTFRPENVKAQQGVSLDLGGLGGNGAFSASVGLLTLFKENEDGTQKDFSKDSIGTKSIFTQFNALTLAAASGVPGASNPYRSDQDGNLSPGGSYETYDFYIYTQHYGNPNWGVQNKRILNVTQTYGDRVFGRMQVKVIVGNAKTGNAFPFKSILVKDFEVIKTGSGSAIRGIEPSVTVDGKLMIFNSNGIGGNGDEIKYIYNPNPKNLNSWTSAKNITLLNSESAAFKAEYALARKPILSALGQPYSPGESLLGAYPWISFEGSEITYMAAHAHHPEAAARRTGFSVLGRWTGNKVRHVDGSFNKDTKGTKTIRLFTTALGSTSSIWNPMRELKAPQLPYLFESPSLFMISSNTGEFSELGFRDFVDGRYEISLPMNPALKKVTQANLINDEFDFNRTADLSQNNLNGTLIGGASFPLESSNGITDAVEQIGFRGQAIKFPSTGYVSVPFSSVFNETNFGSSFEIFVKPLVDLTPQPENAYLFLFHKPGCISLILEKNRQLNGRITIKGKEYSTGFVGSPLELNKWTHVATTHDPLLGLFRIFVNGQRITELKVNQGPMAFDFRGLFIGPGNQNPVNKSGFLLYLDEFKFSSVARSSVELADSAGIPYQQRNELLTNLLPSSFGLRNVRLPSELDLNAKKVQLGFLLFNDARLSINNKISCASCHSENNGFADPVDFSVGVSGKKLVRHSPVVFNRLFGSTQMWDGRFSSLEQQSLGPVTHPAEMGMESYQALAEKLKLNPSYVKAFNTVYGTEITPQNIGNALASFQLSLVAGESRYDSYMDGKNSALSMDEIKGRDLFFGKARCAACHSGPNFTDELYHNTGFFPSDSDLGRGSISGRSSEARSFKTPTLRNLRSTAPYMHNGMLQTLEQVVALYNAGGASDTLRDSEIEPLNLSSAEVTQLVSFLKTLDSEIRPIVSFDSTHKVVEEVYVVPPICDANHPAPHWGVKDGKCLGSCGAIGGTAAFTDPCSNHGMLDAGKAYDV
ncbi:MAG: c-type cytochrome, partial [Bdellovibrionales bacterium]|nr:c-type cytochrome [Bdellovibrionales bacterium]